jgi:hypothetical protein
MNCSTHNNVEAVAYCRTCGKALCSICTRDVRGVIYCENCLADRLHGVQPPTPPPAAGFVPPNPAAGQPVTPGSGPNPALAGILAGFFPFGVGAVYCGQYAKGLAHLVIFTAFVWGLSSGPGSLAPVLGIGLGFFVVYQIIDSVRSARALQTGQPVPDPFGLAHTFSPGEKVDASKIPTGAVVLIGLGVLFLLQNVTGFHFGNLWPFFLIGLGAWLGAVRMGFLGTETGRRTCQLRSLMGPAVLVTLGTLFLIENVNGPGFGRTWPILLLVIGFIKLLGGSRPVGGYGQPPAPPPGTGTGTAPEEIHPPSEVNHV